MYRKPRRLVPVDIDTGEVSTEHYVRSRKQDVAYRRIQESKGRSPQFTFTSMENIKEVISNIDSKHCGYLLYLQCFIDFKGRLVNDNNILMSKTDIQDLLGLGRTAFYHFFFSMLDNKIIYDIGNVFYINEKYHFKGKTGNNKVIKSFIYKVKRLYSKEKVNDLGFIYKVLPFIHLETNTICQNPYEVDVSKILYLSKTEIAELTGESEKTVYNRLRRMKLDKEYLFAEIRSGKERFYKINPFIFYRKEGKPDATLREIFLIGFSNK